MSRAPARLCREADFARICRRGKKKVTVNLVIYYFFTTPTTPLRLGLVVSKKISRSAVVRNLYRRRLLAAWRKVILSNTGFDIVVVAKPSATIPNEEELLEQFRQWHLNIK